MNEKTEVREVKSLAQRHAVINLRSQGLTPRLKADSLSYGLGFSGTNVECNPMVSQV